LEHFLTLPELDASRIGVCGYSWGSRVILGAFHDDPRIKFLVGVSPPLSMMNFDFLLDSEKPKLITIGTHDQIIPIQLLEDFFDKLKEPKELASFNTDHIYIGVEKKLSARVLEFIEKYI
jgi:alpha/beta superfamily hydrolase